MNRNYFMDFLRLFFPSYCYGCRGPMIRFEDLLCSYCLRQMPWKFFRNPSENQSRLVVGPPFSHTFSLLDFHKGGLAQRLLHELKYNHHPEIGQRLGRMLGMHMVRKGFRGKFDLIIPVPLHVSRYRSRGFNQSAVIAEGINELLGAVVNNTVAIRKTATGTQTKKDKHSRWHNVKEAFTIVDPDRIAGKEILLVDDVITTGATIAAFGDRIYRHRPASVSVASIADVSR